MEARTVPADVSDRTKTWMRLYHRWYFLHYAVGVTGIVCSVTVAARPPFALGIPHLLDFMAWASSIAIALLAFLVPIRKAKVYAAAWRLISDATGRYMSGSAVSSQKLYDAMKRGEDLIGGSDAWS